MNQYDKEQLERLERRLDEERQAFAELEDKMHELQGQLEAWDGDEAPPEGTPRPSHQEVMSLHEDLEAKARSITAIQKAMEQLRMIANV